jgi:hypothetical protein
MIKPSQNRKVVEIKIESLGALLFLRGITDERKKVEMEIMLIYDLITTTQRVISYMINKGIR